MKKILLIALAINLVACSNDKNESTETPIVVAKANTFNPNPSPEDYNTAEFLSFRGTSLKKSSKNSSTAKVAAFVATVVPDAALRTKLLSIGAANDNANPSDNIILVDNTRGGLYLDSSGITDLTGIQGFTSLVQLSVASNNLTTVNISGLPNLTYLDCRYNSNLTTVNASAHKVLQQIWCNNNPSLTSLTLPANTITLWGVWCYSSKLSSLNLNGNTKITDLFCQSNQLTSLSLAPYIKLAQINCSSNKFVTVNLNANPLLVSVWCFSNTLLTHLYIQNGNNFGVTNQDFRYNTKAPKVHVNTGFLNFANTSWPNKGTCIYTDTL